MYDFSFTVGFDHETASIRDILPRYGYKKLDEAGRNKYMHPVSFVLQNKIVQTIINCTEKLYTHSQHFNLIF